MNRTTKGYAHEHVLAAELRALRKQAKFATARADDNEATVRRLMATIAHVEALCDEAVEVSDARVDVVLIRAALRRQP